MTKKQRRILLACVLAVILCIAAFGVSRFHFAAGTLIPRDAESVDLRGRTLSAAEYDALQQKLPDCEILWDVPFQMQTVPSNIVSLTVTAFSEEDVALLRYFPELRILDGTACPDCVPLYLAAKAYPDCAVTYLVELGGHQYPLDTEALSLTDADPEALEAKLSCLPSLKQVTLSGELPDLNTLNQLRQAMPDITFHWSFAKDGRTLDTSAKELDLSGMALTYEEAEALLNMLPYGQTMDMRGCGLADEEMMRLADANPDDTLLWDITIGEVTVFTGSEEIDISGQVLEDVEDIESLLPYFPNLKKVIMSHCGFDDETMDALNKRHQDIRFVWSVRIKNVYLRTDATFFYPYKFYRNMTVNDYDLEVLRYCTDLVAIDIGHMVGVTHVEWAAYMPELTYLIVAESSVNNIEPLRHCKKLEFLEIFLTPIQDFSPLLDCPSLVDLNLSYCVGDHTPLMEMTWLEHLWWVSVPYWGIIVPDLEASLPDTTMYFLGTAAATKTGWRRLDNYYAMRDLMGMFYLP